MKEVAWAQMVSRWSEEGAEPFVVGSGEPRDYEAALDYAECLRIEGVGRKEMLRRLNLEGWQNAHGRRRWNTHNLPGSPS